MTLLLLGAADAAAQEGPSPGFTIDGVQLAPPQDLEAYLQRRLALGLLAGTTLHEQSLSDIEMLTTIEELLDSGGLQAERWLMASTLEQGRIDRNDWRLWDEAMGTADRTLRRVRMVRALHFSSGNAAAMLPESCWSADEMLIEAQESARRALLAVGDGRLRSGADGAIDVSAADVATRATMDALDGTIDGEYVAVAEECSAALVATVVAAAGATDDFEAVAPLLAASIRAGIVPRSVWRRIALHRYLGEDAEGLGLLARSLGDADSSWLIEALLAGLARDGERMTELVGTRSDDGAVSRFVLAESHRMSGRYDEALAIYDALIEQDGLFAAAVFGRASTLIALGREDDALADLEHARLAFSATPVYARWVEALGRRLGQ